MKIDFSSIPGGTRSWITVGLVFIVGFLLLNILAYADPFSPEALAPYISSGGLTLLIIIALVIALPLERHWKDWRTMFSVWMLSILAMLASYCLFGFIALLLFDE